MPSGKERADSPQRGDILEGEFWPEPVRVSKSGVVRGVFEIDSVGTKTETLYCNTLDPMDEHAPVSIVKSKGNKLVYSSAIFENDFKKKVRVTRRTKEKTLITWQQRQSFRAVLRLGVIVSLVGILPSWAGWYGHDRQPFPQSPWLICGVFAVGFLAALIQYGVSKRLQLGGIIGDAARAAFNFRRACRRRADLICQWESLFECHFTYAAGPGEVKRSMWATSTRNILPVYFAGFLIFVIGFGLFPKAAVASLIAVQILWVYDIHRGNQSLKDSASWEVQRIYDMESCCASNSQFRRVWDDWVGGTSKCLSLPRFLQREGYWNAFQ